MTPTPEQLAMARMIYADYLISKTPGATQDDAPQFDDSAHGVQIALAAIIGLIYAAELARRLGRIDAARVEEAQPAAGRPDHQLHVVRRVAGEGAAQRVEHQLVDRAAGAEEAQIEAARWLVYHGAWRVDQGTLDAALINRSALDPARRARLKGRHVALVDDVLTSGATLGACIEALEQAGARVAALCVAARVERRSPGGP